MAFETMEKEKKQCPEFPFFGASYPDATCIDGLLWDLDSYEDGNLYKGGEVPCPFCNSKEFIDYHRDENNTVKSLKEYIAKMKEKYQPA